MITNTHSRRWFFKSLLNTSFLLVFFNFFHNIFIQFSKKLPTQVSNPLQNQDVFQLLKEVYGHPATNHKLPIGTTCDGRTLNPEKTHSAGGSQDNVCQSLFTPHSRATNNQFIREYKTHRCYFFNRRQNFSRWNNATETGIAICADDYHWRRYYQYSREVQQRYLDPITP